MNDTTDDEVQPLTSLLIAGDDFDLDAFFDRWPEWRRMPGTFCRSGETPPGAEEPSATAALRVHLVVGTAEIWEQVDALRTFVLQQHLVLATLAEEQPVSMMAQLTVVPGADPLFVQLPAPLLGLLAGLGLRLDVICASAKPENNER